MAKRAQNEMKDLIAAARQLVAIKKKAQALGIFTNDRELLECPGCGLKEDVTFEGFLMTYFKNASLQEDSGLRFREIDESSYTCPVCGATERAEEEVESI
ncbi:MAG: hypothetical protein A2511_04030 [Deltaproteobacteria bacterium RIFOXYD12_FULL_50_9]|nr:MAG: hypothetical protein A2511_04030 [Deltaproteobacteria bacterium RIFOXYD12_FULL_50_9]